MRCGGGRVVSFARFGIPSGDTHKSRDTTVESTDDTAPSTHSGAAARTAQTTYAQGIRIETQS